MHIPTVTTDKIKLVTFDEALAAANTPSEEYDIEKWLYAPNFYSEYRYILGTRGKNPLICIGINPSTAAPDDLDNTLKSVERIALGNGFDSFIMFNVYAQRGRDKRQRNADDLRNLVRMPFGNRRRNRVEENGSRLRQQEKLFRIFRFSGPNVPTFDRAQELRASRPALADKKARRGLRLGARRIRYLQLNKFRRHFRSFR